VKPIEDSNRGVVVVARQTKNVFLQK